MHFTLKNCTIKRHTFTLFSYKISIFFITDYYVEWNGIAAKVIRPDVECVNGVVHVIDKVLMMKRDITVNGSPNEHLGSGMLLASLITFVIARAFH